MCQRILYIVFQIVGCILQIKIMNFILDKIIKLSNKINRIKQFSNINKTSRKFTSSQRADTSAIARKFNFHEGISQSRSSSTKKETIQNFSFRLFRNLFNFPSGGQFSRLDFIKKEKFPDPAEFHERFTRECIIISLLRPCCNCECAYLEKQAAEAEDIYYRPEEAGKLRCCLVLSDSRHSPEQEKFSALSFVQRCKSWFSDVQLLISWKFFNSFLSWVEKNCWRYLYLVLFAYLLIRL